jgi:hypothetical protein
MRIYDGWARAVKRGETGIRGRFHVTEPGDTGCVAWIGYSTRIGDYAQWVQAGVSADGRRYLEWQHKGRYGLDWLDAGDGDLWLEWNGRAWRTEGTECPGQSSYLTVAAVRERIDNASGTVRIDNLRVLQHGAWRPFRAPPFSRETPT